MNNLTEDVVQKQEHLTKDRLDKFIEKYHLDKSDRPKENLIDLMSWVKDKFASKSLKNKDNLSCFIHNTIVMDGAFFTFAEEVKAKIECLHKDSVASWKTDLKYESFLMQGVFKISYKGMEFVQASLFHKGNQNEDEVSFFVVLDSSNYEKYIEFRNQYDEWSKKRDRGNLLIHVVNGEPIPYDRDNSWEDLFMENDLKNEIKSKIEGFLGAKDFYNSKKIAWKMGALFFGDPGNGKSSLIRTIISNYDFKPVTIQNGSSVNDDIITEAFAYAEEQGPSLLYFEDLDSLLQESISLSHFLNLMDGVSSKEGVFVLATANDISGLKQSVVDRPSRFDRKWEVPKPSSDQAFKYLKKWFGKAVKDADLHKIATHCVVKGKFSYAYLKELYITSVYSAISNNRKDPNGSDIKKAVSQLMDDRKKVNQGFVSRNGEEIGFR